MVCSIWSSRRSAAAISSAEGASGRADSMRSISPSTSIHSRARSRATRSGSPTRVSLSNEDRASRTAQLSGIGASMRATSSARSWRMWSRMPARVAADCSMARTASLAWACSSSASRRACRAFSSSRRSVVSSSSEVSRSRSWRAASSIIWPAASRCSSTSTSLPCAASTSARRASRVRRASSAALVSSPARSRRPSQSSRWAFMRRARAAASSRRLAVTACSSRARRRRAASSLRTRSWSSTRRSAASRLAASKSAGPTAMLGDVGASPWARAIRRASRSVSSARSSGPAGRTVNRPCRPGSSPVVLMCVDVVSVVLDALTGGVLPSQLTASSSDPPGSVCHDSCVTRSLARSSTRAHSTRTVGVAPPRSAGSQNPSRPSRRVTGGSFDASRRGRLLTRSSRIRNNRFTPHPYGALRGNVRDPDVAARSARCPGPGGLPHRRRARRRRGHRHPRA